MHTKQPTPCTPEEADRYAAEAEMRWGSTDAWKQSQERSARMTDADREHIRAESDAVLTGIVKVMSEGPKSPVVQALIAKHYNGLRAFYEPTLEIYRGLANLYVNDARFVAYFSKYHEQLPQFLHDAMHAYCIAQTETHS